MELVDQRGAELLRISELEGQYLSKVVFRLDELVISPNAAEV